MKKFQVLQTPQASIVCKSDENGTMRPLVSCMDSAEGNFAPLVANIACAALNGKVSFSDMEKAIVEYKEKYVGL